MGDGGGCHPRDNIAMSWLSNKLGLQSNYYDFIMKKREQQSQFLADLVAKYHTETNLPICLLGTAFKPDTNLEDGSTSLLLKFQLEKMGFTVDTYDPHVDTAEHLSWKHQSSTNKLYFIGCKHHIFQTYQFPKGSFVLDPHRYINNQDGVTIIPIGIGQKIDI